MKPLARLVVSLAAVAAVIYVLFSVVSSHFTFGDEAAADQGICERPVGGVATFSPFTVRFDLRDAQTIDFFVESETGDDLTSGQGKGMTETRWVPSPDVLAAMERAGVLRWGARVLDPSGATIASGEARAFLSP